MSQKLFVGGLSNYVHNYGGLTSVSVAGIPSGGFDVDYSEGQTICLIAPGLLESVNEGGHVVTVCGQEMLPYSETQDVFCHLFVVPPMITMYSYTLHDFEPQVLETQVVIEDHVMITAVVAKGFGFLNEPWQRYKERDACELTFDLNNVDLASIELEIVKNHWWPYIKFVVDLKINGDWEAFRIKEFKVRHGADEYSLDLSGVQDLVDGVRITGNMAFCDFVIDASVMGVEVDSYNQALKECPLVVVALHSQCTNEFDYLVSQINYSEGSTTGGIQLGLGTGNEVRAKFGEGSIQNLIIAFVIGFLIAFSVSVVWILIVTKRLKNKTEQNSKLISCMIYRRA